MFAVGVRCLLSSSPGSTCEANSYFEEEMASTFKEKGLFDTNFCQWLVTISTFASNISTICRTRFAFRVELQDKRMHGLSIRVKCTIEHSSGTKREA